MQLIQAFNAQQYDPTQGVGSLPVGKHPVVVDSSEVKANKNNDGGYLQLNLRVIDGPLQGTTGAYRLNLYHSSQQTVEIAHRQLSAICHVINVFQVTDSSQLHNIPFIVEVAPQKNDPQYTEVKKVFDMNGNEPGKAGAGQQQSQPQGQQQGGFGGGQQQQPQGQGQGGGWGGGAQQQPQTQGQQPQGQGGGAAWGGGGGQQQPQGQQQQPQGGGSPAWGGQPQGQGQQQQPAQQGGAAGWQQGGGAGGGSAPAWGAPR